jgi:hypothetical protein
MQFKPKENACAWQEMQFTRHEMQFTPKEKAFAAKLLPLKAPKK